MNSGRNHVWRIQSTLIISHDETSLVRELDELEYAANTLALVSYAYNQSIIYYFVVHVFKHSPDTFLACDYAML